MLSGSSQPAGLSLRLPAIALSAATPITVSARRVPALIAGAAQGRQAWCEMTNNGSTIPQMPAYFSDSVRGTS